MERKIYLEVDKKNEKYHIFGQCPSVRTVPHDKPFRFGIWFGCKGHQETSILMLICFIRITDNSIDAYNIPSIEKNKPHFHHPISKLCLPFFLGIEILNKQKLILFIRLIYIYGEDWLLSNFCFSSSGVYVCRANTHGQHALEHKVIMIK